MTSSAVFSRRFRMPRLTKGGAFSALLFSAAMIVLLCAHHGPLTWPGAAAALLGALLSLLGMSGLAAAVGVLSAAVSFTAQALVGICASCTYAAFCFAAAGIAALLPLCREKPQSAALLLPLVAALLLYDLKAADYNRALAEGAASPPLAAQVSSGVEEAGVPLLYFSPWCGYCEEPLRLYVGRDPEGRSWRPVVVPSSAAPEGRRMLREMGYRGELLSAPASPAGGLPCLRLPGGRVLVGREEILKVGKGMGR